MYSLLLAERSTGQSVVVRLYRLNGQLVAERVLKPAADGSYCLDLTAEAAGLYLLRPASYAQPVRLMRE